MSSIILARKLDHADLVVEPLDEAERNLVLQPAVGGNAVPIDEISIRKGHDYRIVVSDLVRGRPIWFGGEDRSEASMSRFYAWLGNKKSSYSPRRHGHAAPLSGLHSAFGQQLKDGVELAVDDINTLGGILNRQLRLVSEDDFCDDADTRSETNAKEAAGHLLGQHPSVVIGHACSSSTKAAAEEYFREGVLQITPASTAVEITNRGMWNLFRVCGRDDQQAETAANYIAQNYKNKKIAIVSDKSLYAKDLFDNIISTLKALNVSPVKVTVLDDLSQYRPDPVDLMYVAGYYDSIAQIAKMIKSSSRKITLMAGDTIADKAFANKAGKDADGVLFTFGPDMRKRPSAALIMAKFKARMRDANGYSLYSYAAMQIWAAAASRAGTLDARKVAETMKSGTWNTVIGQLSFKENGDVVGLDWSVYRWINSPDLDYEDAVGQKRGTQLRTKFLRDTEASARAVMRQSLFVPAMR